jgi:methionyl-tRNA formyltransferase
MENKKTSIIYLGTENNEKSCSGLHAILCAGYRVKLVVAYVSSAQSRNNNLRKHLNPLNYYYRLMTIFRKLHTEKESQNSFHTMQTLSSEYKFPLLITSDKTLESVYFLIKEIDYDVLISNGWMFKIDQMMVDTAKVEALNCHSSYLPEYRGGNVTYAPIINGETSTGVTVHVIKQCFDAGEILAQKKVNLNGRITPSSINHARALITGEVLLDALSVVGEKDKYIENPPSPFYFRCDRNTYLRYQRKNIWRKLLGKPTLRYEPQNRFDV